MRQVSPAFLAALPASHSIVVRADVLSGGLVVASLPVTAGSVTIDRANAVRRRCQVTLSDPSLTPRSATDLLTPYGTELALYRGIRLPGGDELIPLGIFGLSKINISSGAAGLVITVDGYDRSRRVARSKITDVTVITAGTNVNTATQGLIAPAVPGLAYALAPTTAVTPLLVLQPADDRWAQAVALQQTIGRELYFDAAGVVVSSPVVDPTTSAPVASYTVGEGGTLLSAARDLIDEQTFNHVIVSGQTSSVTAPVRGEAMDLDPASPTYVNGPYGDVVNIVTSNAVTSGAQATAMAQAILLGALGLTEQVQLTAIVNPAHDVNDVVTITEPLSGTAAQYVLDSLTVPLAHSTPMTAVTRRRGT